MGARCDGCEEEAVQELKGCLLCRRCAETFQQWQAVQASRERAEDRRRRRCQAYVESLSTAERGSSSGQLLNAVMDAMRLQEELADKMRRNEG
jgi:hypothetical protein